MLILSTKELQVPIKSTILEIKGLFPHIFIQVLLNVCSRSETNNTQHGSLVGGGINQAHESAACENGQQVLETMGWLAEHDMSMDWENSLASLDGDTFLQSLIGINMFH